jgi:uncharacterized membrane protein (UPF0127 family)
MQGFLYVSKKYKNRSRALNDRKNTEQPLEIKYLSGSMKIYHIKRSAPNT